MSHLMLGDYQVLYSALMERIVLDVKCALGLAKNLPVGFGLPFRTPLFQV